MINNEQHNPPVSATPTDSFQGRVQPWMMACFGAEISADTAERNHRFLEESLELVQACGCTASEAHQLVDYVFGRPVGERAQEAGGVMVTLAALCMAQGLDMHAASETELARIWTKVEAIRAKQAAKPKHSPLPVEPEQPVALPDLPTLTVPSDEQIYAHYQKLHLPHSPVIWTAALGTVRAVLNAQANAAAFAPPAAAKGVCAEMRALCSACGGTGDMHGLDGEWRGQCTCVHAWQQRAEKAEAELKQVNEWRAAALAENMQLGERWAKRIAELEVQLGRCGAPLSPDTQQAIAAARAAGQTIAATPGGLVFINDGVEPDYSKLDCPACGGSGHAGDVAAGSAP